MRIEDVCCISRGTLSDASEIAKTATELKILKQRSYQANKDIQDALEKTLDDVVYIMNAYCDLYQITPDGEYDVSYQWDDSILVDTDEELNKKMMLMQNGLMSRLEMRQWYFGETERQAQEALTKMNEESMQDMENDLIMQSNGFNQQQKFDGGQPKNNDNNNKPKNS
jgi:A118 family predicted phage portal protein